MSGHPVAAGLALLASQLRADEKRLIEALERRRIGFDYLDARAFWSDTTAAAIETCGDKWRCTLALVGAGLPVPRTALGLTAEAALDALEEIGYPALIKPLVGSWGRLIAELPDWRTAEGVQEYVAALSAPRSRIVYVREFIAKPGRDIRAIVIGGRLIGAAYRVAAGTAARVAVVMAVLDNLVKGCAGNALQCLNVRPGRSGSALNFRPAPELRSRLDSAHAHGDQGQGLRGLGPAAITADYHQPQRGGPAGRGSRRHACQRAPAADRRSGRTGRPGRPGIGAVDLRSTDRRATAAASGRNGVELAAARQSLDAHATRVCLAVPPPAGKSQAQVGKTRR